MLTIDLERPDRLADDHWEAVVVGLDRIDRSVRDADWAAAVGSAKELCETVARVVLASRHDEHKGDFPSTISAAHRTLGRHASQVNERSVRDMAQAAMKLATPLAELRNTLGTGHGRPTVPSTGVEHAEIAVSAAVTWVRWSLRRLDSVIANSVDQLIFDLDSGAGFRRGTLADRLSIVLEDDLGEEDLVRLGRAIAHRGSHVGTFVVAEDGVDAAVAAPERFPEALRRGMIAGLFVDANGYVRTAPADVRSAMALVDSLEDTSFMEEFSRAVEGADFAYAMNLVAAVQISALIAALVGSMREGKLRESWDRLRSKFDVAQQ